MTTPDRVTGTPVEASLHGWPNQTNNITTRKQDMENGDTTRTRAKGFYKKYTESICNMTI